MFRDIPEPLGPLLTLRAAVLGVQPPAHLSRGEQTAALRICACAICLIVQEASRQLGEYGSDEIANVGMRIIASIIDDDQFNAREEIRQEMDDVL